MTAPDPAQSFQTFVHKPAEAISLWLAMAQKYGQHCSGAVFCPDATACDPYVRAAYQILPPHHYKVRAFNGGAAYLLGNGAKLNVSPITCRDEAHDLGGMHWQFMAFHDPASWSEPDTMAYLLGLMRTSQNIKTMLVTVASPLLEASVRERDKPGLPVDYAEITRAVAGGGPR